MSGTKCRLCLCSVDKQTGLFCSVKDETFSGMLKTVFSFPVSSFHKVADKTYDMPALVCLLCATSIRNFFDFSQKVAAVQKKLEKECLKNDNTMSFAELLQLIKTEPVLGEDVIERNGNESLDMSVDIEAISRPTNQKQNYDLRNECSGQSGQNQDWTSDRTDKFVNCVDTEKVIDSIATVERRVNTVVSRLDILLRKSLNPAQISNSHDTFEFNLVGNEEECVAFDAKLSESTYMDKIINWIGRRTGSNDGRQRASHKGEPKIAFKRFQNILKLFRLVGTTNRTLMTDEEVCKFFCSKLTNAKSRLRARGLRRSVMHRQHTRQSKKTAELASGGV